MGKSRPPKVHRYSMHFKATAVRLSELPDVLIQDVAEALDIHPFMLSRWRKQAREGLIVTKSVTLDDETVAELSCFSVEWCFVDHLFFCGAVFGQPLAAD